MSRQRARARNLEPEANRHGTALYDPSACLAARRDGTPLKPVAALARSEDALETAQVELGRRNITLHQSETRLWESQTKLTEANSALWESQTKLRETEVKLWESETKLWTAETNLWHSEAKLRETDIKLQRAASMENAALAELRIALATKNAHLAELEERMRMIEGAIVPEKDAYIRKIEGQLRAMNANIFVKAAWFLHKRRATKQ